MKEQVISDYFRTITEAMEGNDIRNAVSAPDQSEFRKSLDARREKRSLENMDTMFGRVLYLDSNEEEEEPIRMRKGTGLPALLRRAGLFEGYESLAGKILASCPAEDMGIPAINDRRFIRNSYDVLVLSEWGNTIDSHMDYLEAVKTAVFRRLADYVSCLNLPEQELVLFEALAEIELEVLAKEREKLLGEAAEIWKLVKVRTKDRMLVRSVSEDLLEKAGVKETELLINDGKIRFHMPVGNTERYLELFRL